MKFLIYERQAEKEMLDGGIFAWRQTYTIVPVDEPVTIMVNSREPETLPLMVGFSDKVQEQMRRAAAHHFHIAFEDAKFVEVRQ